MSLNVICIDEFGNNEHVVLPAAPRIGDKIPVFNRRPIPTVTEVCWLPHRIDKNLPSHIDLVVTMN